MNPKTLAFYLPQFHRVKENDEWWGEGFTEWTAVRGAEPLFEGHNQPRVPLNNNYYNLLEHDTMAWQAEIMKKYRVDGMCIYHYWFENGRRILEKPAENLLEWKDIDMPFCFQWANQTWAKTWKKLNNAFAWSEIHEVKEKNYENGILLRQVYGRERDWEEHFLYLLPFFRDERYIKVDNKPVFVIYKPSDIVSLWDMTGYFNMRAMQSGFNGIYFIGSDSGAAQGLDAVFTRYPKYRIVSYDEMWESICSEKIVKNCRTYFCGCVDYDNSPRMGKDSTIMKDVSPQTFYKYFKKLYRRSRLLNNEFIFVNAWNEWGESMYLEPDEHYGFGYLEALRRAITECGDEALLNECDGDSDGYTKKDADFNTGIYKHDLLLHNWLCLKENAVDFSTYFKKYGYQSIAIYGMGKLGMHLLCEMRGSDVEVRFGIDENNGDIICEKDVYNPNHRMPEADAVVITIIGHYSEIAQKLRKNMDCPMIALEEIMQELLLQ